MYTYCAMKKISILQSTTKRSVPSDSKREEGLNEDSGYENLETPKRQPEGPRKMYTNYSEIIISGLESLNALQQMEQTDIKRKNTEEE